MEDSLASWIIVTTFLRVAFLFMKTGAECTAAALILRAMVTTMEKDGSKSLAAVDTIQPQDMRSGILRLSSWGGGIGDNSTYSK